MHALYHTIKKHSLWEMKLTCSPHMRLCYKDEMVEERMNWIINELETICDIVNECHDFNIEGERQFALQNNSYTFIYIFASSFHDPSTNCISARFKILKW